MMRLRPRLFRILAPGLWGGAMAVLLQSAGFGKDIGPGDFGAPVLDGVRAEVAAASSPDLRTYAFLGKTEWPAIRLYAPKPLDWSRADALALDVENPDSSPFRLLIRVDDNPGANGDERSLTGTTEVAPHQHVTLLLPLDNRFPGMRARPPAFATSRQGERVIGEVEGSVDLSHVTALHISGFRSDADRMLRIGQPVLRPRVGGQDHNQPIADRFGQSITGSWPEKVASEAELRARLRGARAETGRLAETAFPTIDAYGGIDGRTRLPATGYFRADKAKGRWFLVTPAGHRFFSLGVDDVTSSNRTRIAGRSWMFEGLPASSSPLARYYEPPGERDGAKIFDFGAADLERGLGPDWQPRWRAQVLQRLKAWGFNTLGNWTEAALTNRPAMPYVSFFDFEGDSANVPMAGGRSLPDPFDPRFATVADGVAETMTANTRTDPFLIGYFSGNELPWGKADRPDEGIAAHVLALGPDSPAKQAMVEDLRARYGLVAEFSSAWGVPRLADWADVLARPLAWPSVLTASAKRDIVEFQARFADLYYGTVAQAIKRHDPKHLYLGTRFGSFTPEVVEACAKWCDVLSFNVYGRSPEEAAAAWRRFDRPVLIGEFHFGTTDRGSFWSGMVDVGTETARGPAYEAYLSAALQDSDIVGCHWFRYADEPLTGLPYDGENGHIGLVAVTDVPFGGFVAAVAAANRRTLTMFAAQGRPDSP